MDKDSDRLAEASETLKEVWKITPSLLDKHEKDFMQAMKDMMMWLVTDSDNDKGYNPLDSAYDSTDFLHSYSKAIKEYMK